jgi:TPP-dependent pyruvate/acetoin dehydrogenase alpha subunit
MQLPDTGLLEMYRLMVLTRRFEEKARQWYGEGRISECPHSSIGQEAIGVGASYGLRLDDQIVPSLRTRAAFFTKGVTLRDTLATMACRKNGFSGGRDTSHHAGIPELGIMAGTAVVGAHILPSVGAALAMKIQRRDSVVVTFFGDGASNQGAFHEGLNFAGVKNLPVIFVCENNQWAQGTSFSESTAVSDIAVRASSYGFPGVCVDGNDVVAIHDSRETAVRRARAGEGPTLIECKTLRWRPHCELAVMEKIWKSETDEVERWRTRDPIQRLEQVLLERGVLTADKIKRLNDDIDVKLEDAIAYAESSPVPSPREALEGIYAE